MMKKSEYHFGEKKPVDTIIVKTKEKPQKLIKLTSYIQPIIFDNKEK